MRLEMIKTKMKLRQLTFKVEIMLLLGGSTKDVTLPQSRELVCVEVCNTMLYYAMLCYECGYVWVDGCMIVVVSS